MSSPIIMFSNDFNNASSSFLFSPALSARMVFTDILCFFFSSSTKFTPGFTCPTLLNRKKLCLNPVDLSTHRHQYFDPPALLFLMELISILHPSPGEKSLFRHTWGHSFAWPSQLRNAHIFEASQSKSNPNL